jgi:hypothetical protein
MTSRHQTTAKIRIAALAGAGLAGAAIVIPDAAAATGGVEAAVDYCVEQARQPQPGELQRNLHNGFDAFYNPGTGEVEHNATLWGNDQPAVFAFQKCMAQQGHPLAHLYPSPWW